MAQNAKMTLNLDFEVNTQKLNQLTTVIGNALSQIKVQNSKTGMSSEVEKTVYSLTQLKEILTSSWNSKMNQLDLTKVNNGLRQAGLSAQQLKNSLSKYPQIYESFSRQILNSNIQLKESNKLLDKMAVTMANTVRFGISSSIFNNMTGALQKSYQYVQNLDKSLNSIRIVSGYSADYMEKFAKNANKAAQSLGATTLDYTNASLIYAQQGLDADQIQKRTELTLKMANVTGDAADEVSSYMTAIWNNFAKGSENLEHYADVITALGAATASSSSEIAAGLEKFASVGETIGLSYEYATSALATVVATTRQSADVVGTAFKTLFSRIQGLSLGETLDDGTTLNKYSEALNKVGVNIKDQNGELKDMDDILDEMGSKWKTLDKDQKVALAQTVAGVRQYNQMMSLMDNWDFFKQNLNIANNAEGKLQEQQNLYMDSIEAHMNKLSAEWEKLYDTIFDEEAIKSFADVATKALSLVNSYLTGIGGGLKSIAVLGANAANLFSGQIAKAASRGLENKRIQQQAEDDTALKQSIIDSHSIDGNKIRDEALQVELDAAIKIASIRKQLTSEEYNELTNKQKKIGLLKEELQKYEEIKKEAEKAKLTAVNKNPNAFRDIGVEILKDGDIGEIDEEKAKKISSDDIQDLIDNTKLYLKTREWEDEEEANQLGKYFADQTKEWENQKKKIKEYEKIQEEDSIELTKAQLKAYQDEIEKVKQLKQEEEELQSFVKGTTSFLATGVTIWGTIETITAKGVSNLDKAKSILMVLATQGTMLVKNFSDMGSAIASLPKFFSGVGEGISAAIAAKKAKAVADTTDTANEIANTVAKEANVVATTKEAAAEGVAAKAKTENAIASGEVVAAEGAEVAANTAVSTSNTVVSATSKGAAKSVAELGASFGATIVTMLPYLGIALAVGVAMFALYKALDTTDHKLEKLNKNVEASSEAFRKTQEKVAECLNTISSYSDARTTLEGLEEGTLEWYQALVKANEAAQDIIDTWGLVMGEDYTIGPGGQIQITEEALKESAFKANQESFRSQGRVFTAKAKLSEYQSEKTIDQFGDELQKKYYDRELRTEGGQEKFIKEIVANPVNYKKQQESFREDAKALLQGKDIKTKEENIPLNKEVKEMIGENSKSMSIMKDNALRIGDEIGKYLPEYQKSIEETQQYMRSAADAYIRGYGTKEQVETYDSYTEKQKEVVQDYVGKKVQQYADSLDKIDINTSKNTWLKYIKEIGYHTTGGLIGDKSYTEGQSNNEFLREQYAKNVMGAKYNGDQGIWIDKNGKTVDLNKIDIYEAQRAYESGEYVSNDYFNAVMDDIKNIRERISENEKFNSDSVDYITEAITNYKYGNKDYDLSKLSNEEFKSFKNNYEYEGVENASITDGEFNKAENYIILLEKINKEEKRRAENGQNTDARRAEDLKKYNDELERQASLLGTTKSSLGIYAAAMKKINKDTSDNTRDTAKNAAEKYKFNKEYNQSVKTFNDNKDAFDRYRKAIKSGKVDDITYDIADAMGEIAKQTRDFLGLDLSDEFFADSKNLDLINKMMTGTQKEAKAAYEELRKLGQIDALTHLGLDIETAKGILNEVSNTKIGENVQLSPKYINALKEMIDKGNYTKEQVEGILKSADLQLGDGLVLKETTYNLPEETVEHVYDGQMPDPTGRVDEDGNLMTLPIKYKWKETTTPVKKKFVLPDNVEFKKVNKTVGSFAKGTANTKNTTSKGGSKSKINKQERQKDPYHDVNIKLKNISNTLEKLEEQEEHLTGNDKIKNLSQQIDQLNKQIETTAEKFKIATQEENRLKKELGTFGVKFNKDGDISNYFSIENNLYNKMETARTKYNKKMTDANKKAYEKAKENYEKFQKLYKEYDDTHTELKPGLTQQQLEDAYKIIEKQVESFEIKLNVRLDLAEATKDWNQWKREYIDEIDEDNIMGNARSVFANELGMITNPDGTYSFGGTDSYALSESVKNLMSLANENINNTNSIFNHNGIPDEELWQEKLQEGIKTTEEQFENLKEDIKKFAEYYLDMIDEAAEKIADQQNLYEEISEQLNHDINLISKAYGEDAYDKLDKFYKGQVENTQGRLNFARQSAAMWEAEMAKIKDTDSDEYKAFKENWENAIKEVADYTEQLLEDLANEFNNYVQLNIQNVEKGITNGLGLDYATNAWEMLKENSDEYLDQINGTFGIQELKNKYLGSIDETDNIKQQQKLKDLMDEEIAALKEKDKLSQYDLDRANLKYQIALKQIQLEEAQQNKTTLRLRRDSQGNYTYQYVADEDKVKSLKEEVANLYNQLYNLDKNKYKENLDYITQQTKAFNEEILRISNIEDAELREAEKLRITAEYENRIKDHIADNLQIQNNLRESALLELKDLQAEQYKDIIALTDEEMSKNVDIWDNKIQDMIDKIVEDGGIEAVYKEALDNIDKATEDFHRKNIDLVEEEIVLTEHNIGLIEDMKKNEDDLLLLYQQQLEEIGKMKSALDEVWDEYIRKAKEAMELANQVLNKELHEDIGDKEGERNEGGQAIPEPEVVQEPIVQNQQSPIESPKPTPTPTPKPQGESKASKEKGVAAAIWTLSNFAGWGSGKTRTQRLKNKNVLGAQDILNSTSKLNDALKNYKNKASNYRYGAFNTGGYTGNWVGEGRFAMLHQKELVLNATDTKNMLNAVSIIRSITNGLGGSVLAKMAEIGSNTQGVIGGNGSTLKQQVDITATFPNVTSQNEIEQALTNLVNVASQRVNQK